MSMTALGIVAQKRNEAFPLLLHVSHPAARASLLSPAWGYKRYRRGRSRGSGAAPPGGHEERADLFTGVGTKSQAR